MMRILLIYFFILGGMFCCSQLPAFSGEQTPFATDTDGDDGGVTVQDTPQRLEQTIRNYKYSPFAQSDPDSDEMADNNYVQAIRNWLNQLPPVQRETARAILREAHPRMQALRMAISEKKAQLASLSFDRNTPPETLPRLGQELQILRDELLVNLHEVESRLKNEGGIVMGPLGGDGFWLAPPSDTPYVDLPLAGEKLSDQLPEKSTSMRR